MAKGADRSRRGDGRERDPLIGATPAELLAAYRAAVARRDEWLQAYLTVCLYQPASDCGSDWQLELISDQVTRWVLVSQ
jgi:hypothetical protein